MAEPEKKEVDIMSVPDNAFTGFRKRGQGRPPGPHAPTQPHPIFGATQGRKLTLKGLRSRHHRILEMAATGRFTNIEIANAMNLTPQTVSNTLNSEWGRMKLAALTSRLEDATLGVIGAIQELAPAAVMTMEEILFDSPDDRLRQKTAQAILDMGGYGATKKLDMTVRPGDKQDTIAEIKKRALAQKQVRKEFEEAEIIIENTNENGDEDT